MEKTELIDKYIILSYLAYDRKIANRQTENSNNEVMNFFSNLGGDETRFLNDSINVRFQDVSYFNSLFYSLNLTDMVFELNQIAQTSKYKQYELHKIFLPQNGTGIEFIDKIFKKMGLLELMNFRNEREEKKILNSVYLRSYENAIKLSK